jgi:hypothetical protein
MAEGGAWHVLLIGAGIVLVVGLVAVLVWYWTRQNKAKGRLGAPLRGSSVEGDGCGCVRHIDRNCYDCNGIKCQCPSGPCQCVCYEQEACVDTCSGDPCVWKPNDTTFAFTNDTSFNPSANTMTCWRGMMIAYMMLKPGLSSKQAFQKVLDTMSSNPNQQTCPMTCNDATVPWVDLSTPQCQNALLQGQPMGINCQQIGARIKAAVATGQCQVAT